MHYSWKELTFSVSNSSDIHIVWREYIVTVGGPLRNSLMALFEHANNDFVLFPKSEYPILATQQVAYTTFFVRHLLNSLCQKNVWSICHIITLNIKQDTAKYKFGTRTLPLKRLYKPLIHPPFSMIDMLLDVF